MAQTCIFAFFALCVLVKSSVQQLDDDHCSISLPIRARGTDGVVPTPSTPANCAEGSLTWHYPHGHLPIDFPRDALSGVTDTVEIKACLKGDLGDDIESLTQQFIKANGRTSSRNMRLGHVNVADCSFSGKETENLAWEHVFEQSHRTHRCKSRGEQDDNTSEWICTCATRHADGVRLTLNAINADSPIHYLSVFQYKVEAGGDSCEGRPRGGWRRSGRRGGGRRGGRGGGRGGHGGRRPGGYNREPRF